MSTTVVETGAYKNLAATANCSVVSCKVIGFLCSTTSSGTVQLYDDTATGTSTPITAAITVVAGQFYPVPAQTINGLYCVISGTCNITLFYAA